MGINPFNQPGVEAYKTNMFALLGKPKFEKATEDVKARLAALPKDTSGTVLRILTCAGLTRQNLRLIRGGWRVPFFALGCAFSYTS